LTADPARRLTGDSLKTRGILHPEQRPRVAAATKWTSALGGIGALLVPKCPFCVFGYAGALAATGIDAIRFMTTLRWIVLAAVALSAGTVFVLATRRRDFVVSAVALFGGVLAVLGWLELGRSAELAGSFVVVASGWANARRCDTRLAWAPVEEPQP
jgi:hypothetical protein